MPRFLVGMFLTGELLLIAPGTFSQAYPNKPIRIVTFEAGGGLDFAARIVAQGLTGTLGTQVIVDNRSGTIAIDTVAKAPPDGYSLLVSGGVLWLWPLMQNTPYDPVRDFSPVTLLGSAPNVLVAHPSLPVKSVKELIDLARAQPGKLNYATAGTGGSPHLAAELFKSMARVNIVRIQYRGAAQALTDVISGEVQLGFPNMAAVIPHIKPGRLRALAVTSSQPSALAPGLPTIAASGLPGYESVLLVSMLAPAGTSASLINRLSQETRQILNRTETKERFFKAGTEAMGSSPEEMAIMMKSDMARMGRVIRDAGIRAD